MKHPPSSNELRPPRETAIVTNSMIHLLEPTFQTASDFMHFQMSATYFDYEVIGFVISQNPHSTQVSVVRLANRHPCTGLIPIR